MVFGFYSGTQSIHKSQEYDENILNKYIDKRGKLIKDNKISNQLIECTNLTAHRQYAV